MITTDVDTIAYADEHLDEQTPEPNDDIQTVEQLAAANGWEVIDFAVARPARTATACTAHGCTKCAAWVEGPPIGAYPSCRICTHTEQLHRPRPTKITKRGTK